MIDISSLLDQKLTVLEKHLGSAIFERDHSATPMESHSDKSRQIAEQQIDALNDEKSKLTSLRNELGKYTSVYYHVSTSSGKKTFVIVPEGLGGNIVDGVTLVSENSLLGKKLKTSKTKDTIELVGQSFRIDKISS